MVGVSGYSRGTIDLTLTETQTNRDRERSRGKYIQEKAERSEEKDRVSPRDYSFIECLLSNCCVPQTFLEVGEEQ